MPVNKVKAFLMPDQATVVRIVGHWSKRKLWIWRIIAIIVVSTWFGLWYYLRVQVQQGRAKVEQARIEASRRQELARRQASYQQALERYQQGSRQQPQRYGQ